MKNKLLNLWKVNNIGRKTKEGKWNHWTNTLINKEVNIMCIENGIKCVMQLININWQYINSLNYYKWWKPINRITFYYKPTFIIT